MYHVVWKLGDVDQARRAVEIPTEISGEAAFTHLAANLQQHTSGVK